MEIWYCGWTVIVKEKIYALKVIFRFLNNDDGVNLCTAQFLTVETIICTISLIFKCTMEIMKYYVLYSIQDVPFPKFASADLA